MNEPPSVSGWSEVWILLGAGRLHVPDGLPCLVELFVDRVDARVMGCNSVALVYRYVIQLQTTIWPLKLLHTMTPMVDDC